MENYNKKHSKAKQSKSVHDDEMQIANIDDIKTTKDVVNDQTECDTEIKNNDENQSSKIKLINQIKLTKTKRMQYINFDCIDF